MNLAKRSVLLTALALHVLPSLRGQGDYISRIIEYYPAPGQYINDTLTGTPRAAKRLAGGVGSAVSLGAFGGYIIAGFDHTVENDPENPYGVDFTIFGNAFSGSAEPGIVRVMKDENGNGLPDDTWYEIAGSWHVSGRITKNYQIVYKRPQPDDGGGVYWHDNLGDTGSIRHNPFHPQPYYPSTEYFPSGNQDSLIFNGNRIHVPVHAENGILKTTELLFGYADNHASVDPYSVDGPDNPYTSGILEGTGGDPFDISWATDSAGHYPDLDGIDFIMIMTAANAEAGPLGEISTDITGIRDVRPDRSLHGITGIISLESIPSEIPVQTHLTPDPVFFDHGRPEKMDFVITSSDESIARINENNELEALSGGSVSIIVRPATGDELMATKVIRIVQPSGLKIDGKFDFLTPGERGLVNYTVFDQDGNSCNGIIPAVSMSDTGVAKITALREGQIEITATGKGSTDLVVSVPGTGSISTSMQVHVIESGISKEVSVSVKLPSECLIPRRTCIVKKTDIRPYVDDGSGNGEGDVKDFISLADVLASVFVSAGFTGDGNTFRFRRDHYSGGRLYLWQVGMNWEFYYGWGGNTGAAPYRKCWVTSVNDKVFLNDLDNVPVEEGDVISVYQVNDISGGWENLSLFQKKGHNQAEPGIILDYHLHRYDLLSDSSIIIREQDLPGSSLLYANGKPVGTVDELSSPGLHSMTFIPEEAGNYTLTLGDYPQEVIHVQFDGITRTSPLPAGDFRVFPNPFKDVVHLLTNTKGTVRIMITDLTGKVLYQGESREGISKTINTSHYPPGAYILRIQKGQKMTAKILFRL